MSNAIDEALARKSRMLDHARSALTAPALMGSSGRSAGSPALPFRTTDEDPGRFYRSWAYAAISAVAKRVASRPIHAGRVSLTGHTPRSKAVTFATHASLPSGMKAASAHVEELLHHPALDSLNDPNPQHTRYTLIFGFIAALELSGRAFLWITSAADGRKSIWNVPPHWVTGYTGAARRVTWKVRPDGSGEEFDVPADDMIFAFHPSPSDPNGWQSPLQAAMGAVLIDEAIETSQRATFANGILPRYALTAGRLPGMAGTNETRPVLSGAQRAQLTGMIRQAHAGTAKHGDPIIIDGMIEAITKLDRAPAEMDFLSSSTVAKEKILQVYGVSPIILGSLENSNRAAALVAEQVFLSQRVNPAIELLSQALCEWAGPHFASGPNEKVLIWLEPDAVRDAEIRLRELQLLATSGAATIDELRAELGFGPADSPHVAGDRPPGQVDGMARAILGEVDRAFAKVGIDALLAPHLER